MIIIISQGGYVLKNMLLKFDLVLDTCATYLAFILERNSHIQYIPFRIPILILIGSYKESPPLLCRALQYNLLHFLLINYSFLYLW